MFATINAGSVKDDVLQWSVLFVCIFGLINII